jgi:hypothetical protein
VCLWLGHCVVCLYLHLSLQSFVRVDKERKGKDAGRGGAIERWKSGRKTEREIIRIEYRHKHLQIQGDEKGC